MQVNSLCLQNKQRYFYCLVLLSWRVWLNLRAFSLAIFAHCVVISFLSMLLLNSCIETDRTNIVDVTFVPSLSFIFTALVPSCSPPAGDRSLYLTLKGKSPFLSSSRIPFSLKPCLPQPPFQSFDNTGNCCARFTHDTIVLEGLNELPCAPGRSFPATESLARLYHSIIYTKQYSERWVKWSLGAITQL